MKKLFLTALMALASVIPAHAQTATPDAPPRFELGFNPISYLRQDGKDLWGGSLSLAMRRSERLNYVLDISIHQTRPQAPKPDATPYPDAFTTSAYRFGLRYYTPARGKFKPFVEVLAGGANIGATMTTTITPDPPRNPITKTTIVDPSHTGVAFAAGGGVDYSIKRWL